MAAPQWKGGKCKSVQQAKAFFRHNDKDRRMETQHTNPHIDKSKTHENFTYRGLDYRALCKAFDDKMSSVDVGRESSGKNARVVLQSVVLYPPKGLTREQEKDWFMDAGRVLEARYGDDFLEMQVDMDEEHEYTDKDTAEKVMSRNHGHARLFPAVDGKLNGKAFSGSANMRALNHALDVMSVQKYGVHMMDGTKKKGGKTVESLKAASLRVEVEELERVAGTIIQDAMDAARDVRADAREYARETRAAADRDRAQARQERNAAWVDAQDVREDADEYARRTRHKADEDADEVRQDAERDARDVLQQAADDARAMQLQLAAARTARDEVQADCDALQQSRKTLCKALQGDLRLFDARQDRTGAADLLAALGASVRPSAAPAPGTVRDMRAALASVPPVEVSADTSMDTSVPLRPWQMVQRMVAEQDIMSRSSELDHDDWFPKR